MQELVIHNDLLDNFLDEIIGFQTDKSIEVRKFVVGFIEASCIKDSDYFTKLIINLNYFLNDPNSNVVKKTIQTGISCLWGFLVIAKLLLIIILLLFFHLATKLFKHFLIWLNKTKEDEQQCKAAIEEWNRLKQPIIEMLDTTENDGIRTQCIKFMEVLVILQTKKDKWTILDTEFDLNEIKRTNLVNLEHLENEAKSVFENLIEFHGSPHISSVNLMTTMQSLVLICRNRSSYFMAQVIQAMEALHANLPPTLSKSQVVSVRKQLKLQLQILLKHPAAVLNPKYQLQITQLLLDLGATQSDINKCFQEVRKRGLKIEQAQPEPKRIKLESDSNSFKSEPSSSTNQQKFHELRPIDSNLLKVTKTDAFNAVDATAESLVSKLSNIENACDLVLLSLLSLPDQMPPHFLASYTPVGTAGSPLQIKHLAHLLATQFTSAGIGKGVQDMICKIENSLGNEKIEDEQHHKISSLISRGISQEIKKQESIKNKALMNIAPTTKTVSVSKAMKQLNFAEITKEPSKEFRYQMIYESIKRILNDEDKQNFTAAENESKIKILSRLASTYYRKNIDIFNLIKDYAFNDLRNKMIILISIVNEEYNLYKKNSREFTYFNNSLVSIITDFIYKTDPKDRDHFLPKFFAELTDLTDDSLSLLKDYILLDKQTTIENGFNIAKLLIENIGSFRYKILDLILELSTNPAIEIRNEASKLIKQLHDESDDKFKKGIERASFEMLQKLLNPNEPQMDEETIKLNLLPYLNLLSSNHSLIHNLANIYVSMNPNLKRVILRSLETPVKGMGMNSPELLLLVENCPKGAETLITRIIHVLTDKQPPSNELVSRVRDLYNKRVSDVRFLIPVLNGLTKKEVIDALPDLIMLNPNVVKEVFNRLLNENSNFQSKNSLTPSELLIALHNIDTKKCDMKTIIKATSLCFAEKNVYTSETLAVVIQLLMEQNPLPTLLMRTVIQSVSLYPSLIGYVMNVLQRLIVKQVWKQKKVWEGFIKCCDRTKPKSFQVLLQLPAPQLRSVFINSPNLKIELQQFMQSVDNTQKNVPQSILDAIFKDYKEEEEESNPKIIDDKSESSNLNENSNSEEASNDQQPSNQLQDNEQNKNKIEDEASKQLKKERLALDEEEDDA